MDSVSSPTDCPWRCPLTGSKLRAMSYDECAEINRQIVAGTLYNRLGQRVTEQLEAGLIGLHEQWAYRIQAGIPQLLCGEALRLTNESTAE